MKGVVVRGILLEDSEDLREELNESCCCLLGLRLGLCYCWLGFDDGARVCCCADFMEGEIDRSCTLAYSGTLSAM